MKKGKIMQCSFYITQQAYNLEKKEIDFHLKIRPLENATAADNVIIVLFFV